MIILKEESMDHNTGVPTVLIGKAVFCTFFHWPWHYSTIAGARIYKGCKRCKRYWRY
jgi:hypothetical protein